MLSYIRIREARPATHAWNIAKTLFQAAAFWSVFLWLLPAAIYSLEETELTGWRFRCRTVSWVGGTLFILASALGLTSNVVMAVWGRGTPFPLDCPRALVTQGPYRCVRNPMAISGIAQGMAVGLYLGSPAVVLYALLGAGIWQWLIRPWEEADLERRFGEAYRHYRASVPCWIPSLRGYVPPGSPSTEPPELVVEPVGPMGQPEPAFPDRPPSLFASSAQQKEPKGLVPASGQEHERSIPARQEERMS
jgi:protein-S-isoprenylcysteine O-methyltransferase Ste14